MKAKITLQLLKGLPHETSRYEVCDTEISGFRLRVLPSGKLRYTYRYTNPLGAQRVYSLGGQELAPNQARNLARQCAGRVALGEDIQGTRESERRQHESKKATQLLTFVEDVWYPRAQNTQASAAETLRLVQKDFVFLQKTPLAEITYAKLMPWVAKQTLAPATINRRVSALQGILSYAVDLGVLDRNPLQGFKRLKTDRKKPVRHLSHAEEQRLRDALATRDADRRRERDSYNAWRAARGMPPLPPYYSPLLDYLKPLILLALNTGLRRGELFKLRWEDINFDTKQLTVCGEHSKNGQTRYLPLNREALSVLTDWKSTQRNALVFPSPQTDGVMDNITTSWRNLTQAAKLPGLRFHDLRHTFASNLVMRGVDLNTVRELLGHRDYKTTLIYAHLAPEHNAAAVAVLDSPETNATLLTFPTVRRPG